MGFKNVLYFGVFLFGFIYILLGFAQGVYNSHFAVRFYVVGALCQASGIYLFNFHLFQILTKLQKVCCSVCNKYYIVG